MFLSSLLAWRSKKPLTGKDRGVPLVLRRRKPTVASPRDSLNNEFPGSFRARSTNRLPDVPLPGTRVYGNGQTHHKPGRIGRDPQVEIQTTVAEQSHTGHASADLDPTRSVPEAFLQVAEPQSEEQQQGRQEDKRSRQSSLRHHLQVIIMDVCPMHVGGEDRILREGVLKTAHSHADAGMSPGDV